LKYRKHEHSELSDSMRFVDKNNQEIPAAIEYDTETGYATVYELASATHYKSEIFYPQSNKTVKT
jgi:hypothetical protein